LSKEAENVVVVLRRQGDLVLLWWGTWVEEQLKQVVVEVSSLESAKLRTSHVGRIRDLPWARRCAREVGRYLIL
jgi:hypothetical protein